MRATRNRSVVLIASSVLLVGIFGCPELAPPPEAVLEGTWEVVPTETFGPQFKHLYLTFDSGGELSQVKYTFVDLATVTWDYPPSSVSVDGDQIQVSATSSGNGLSFIGTLDSATDPAQADGDVSANVNIGNVRATVSKGEASLVKQ